MITGQCVTVLLRFESVIYVKTGLVTSVGYIEIKFWPHFSLG